MAPRQRYGFWIDVEQRDGLRFVKERDGVLESEQIRRAIDSKSDHTVPEDFFLDMLDEQFSEEECLRQMETAVAWGRYAELFDYDSSRRRFVLPDSTEEVIGEESDSSDGGE